MRFAMTYGMSTDNQSRYYNEDLAPPKERRWKSFDLFAMWMSDIHSIGGYTFAAGLFFLGLTGWQVLLALVIGIVIVFFGVNLVGIAGQRLGVPFPVLARMSFGIVGSNIPALIRGIAAIFWYGIQTYLASIAVVALLLRLDPGLSSLAHGSILGLSPLGWISFMALWLLQLSITQFGMEIIRKFQDFAGTVVWIVMIGLAIWMVTAAHGHITMTVSPLTVNLGDGILRFATAIALTVSYFSTLLLNFCDFSRFAPDKRTVIKGNLLGLPVNFTAFALLSVIVTGATITVFGKAITDPVLIVNKVSNTGVLVVGSLMFIVATIGINIVANFISPAYDLSNMWPNKISFKMGGFLAALASVVILPWKIFANPAAVNYFLGGLGAFLGPLFGIIIVDFFIVRNQMASVEELYQDGPQSRYWYSRGVNPLAIASFIPAAVISTVLALLPSLSTVAPFGWFIGAAISAGTYLLITRNSSLVLEHNDVLSKEVTVVETVDYETVESQPN